MKLRDALIQQSPSLELQRAAAAEIARMDAALARLLAPNASVVGRDVVLTYPSHSEAFSALAEARRVMVKP